MYFGNGLATSKNSADATNSNNFGVGLVGKSSDNLIEKNQIGGNLNGVYIDSSGDAGNVVRRNVIAGNPPAQVSTTFGVAIGADIQDMSSPGSNVFEDNRCLTYAGAGASPCPSVGKPGDEEDSELRDMADFGRNRLAFPHARLVDAVFHLRARPLAYATAVAMPRQVTDVLSVGSSNW
jgi:parallel beta-helix repeat protein